MNMHWRIAMGNVRTVACALVLFGSLVVCASSVLGQLQPCLPVVYAFRHAEDTLPTNHDPLFALTPTGEAHAALYVGMVLDFTFANHFCPVTKVYATTKEGKVGQCGSMCTSTTNPFDTAAPLAKWVMSGRDPITTVVMPTVNTEECPKGVCQLYEFLGNGNTVPLEAPKNYITDTAMALRTALLATANRGESSAIFWTSDGLHVLGGAIINATSNVRQKIKGVFSPPRNAVYLFKAIGSAPNITGFSDTPTAEFIDTIGTPSERLPHPVPSSVYVQCFNHVEVSDKFKTPQFIPPNDSVTQYYYCGYGYQSDLGGKPGDSCDLHALCGSSIDIEDCELQKQCGSSIEIDENQFIKGKICDTRTSMLTNTKDTGIFGACWGLP